MPIRTDLVNKIATASIDIAALAFLLSDEDRKELAEWLKEQHHKAPEDPMKHLFLDIRTFILDTE